MNKKEIRVKFLGTFFEHNNDWENHTLYPILKKNYNLVICDDPDYVIATCLDKPFNYCNYDCIRILFTGEPFSPDFNVFDYAISSDNIIYDDRFYQFQQFNSMGWAIEANKKHLDIPDNFLEKKEYFCDFIYKNSNGQKEREEIFHKLNEYKRVESGGSWLNNMPNNKVIGWPDEKQVFQKKCKFTIAFDSIRHKDFITEKISNSFMNKTIPIYLGAPNVDDIFNEKAFINCMNYESLDHVLERVKYLDDNDEEYLKMLREPAFKDPNYAINKYNGLEEFICNIFDQDLKTCKRRYDKFSSKYHNDLLRKINWAIQKEENTFKKLLKTGHKRLLRKILGEKYDILKNKLGKI